MWWIAFNGSAYGYSVVLDCGDARHDLPQVFATVVRSVASSLAECVGILKLVYLSVPSGWGGLEVW